MNLKELIYFLFYVLIKDPFLTLIYLFKRTITMARMFVLAKVWFYIFFVLLTIFLMNEDYYRAKISLLLVTITYLWQRYEQGTWKYEYRQKKLKKLKEENN